MHRAWLYNKVVLIAVSTAVFSPARPYLIAIRFDASFKLI